MAKGCCARLSDRCQRQMGSYGDAMVKGCVDLDREAHAALARYPSRVSRHRRSLYPSNERARLGNGQRVRRSGHRCQASPEKHEEALRAEVVDAGTVGQVV